MNDFCSFCNGRGTICIKITNDDSIEPIFDTCPDCGGDGEYRYIPTPQEQEFEDSINEQQAKEIEV